MNGCFPRPVVRSYGRSSGRGGHGVVRLVTYSRPGDGRDRIGVQRDDDVVPMGGPATMLQLLRLGEEGIARARSAAETAVRGEPLAELRLRAPLPRPNSMRDFMLVEE